MNANNLSSISRSSENNTIIDQLLYRSQQNPDGIAFVFIQDNGQTKVELTFAELEQKSRQVAAGLNSIGDRGDRVALLLPNGLGYIAGFFGCLFADRVAVPLYPARLKDKHSRTDAVVNNCQATAAICLSQDIDTTRAYFDGSEFNFSGELLTFEQLIETPLTEISDITPSQPLSYLQYTSGSTGIPKGAIISHQNVVANLDSLIVATDCSDQDVFVNWLPLFHDLGLVNTMLLPVYIGAKSVIMMPPDFIRDPLGWFRTIEAYRGTICGGPNFSYDHCVKVIKDEDVLTLDLSHWKVAFNAGEPIRVKTLKDFEAKFSKAGFADNAFYPSYGMAEVTVFLTGGDKTKKVVITDFSAEALSQYQVLEVTGEAVKNQQLNQLVGCGQLHTEHEVTIVDPYTLAVVPDNKMGEIWITGPSVALGYWGAEQATVETYQARLPGDDIHYLRTGDLGFIYQNELYIGGRIKDVIIIRGSNYYPQDIEFAIEEVLPDYPIGSAAAFSVDVNSDEKLVLVQEVRATKSVKADQENIVSLIRQKISLEFGLEVYAIILVRIGKLLKTSSGKVKRQLTRLSFIEETLVGFHEQIFSHVDRQDGAVQEIDTAALLQLPTAERKVQLNTFLLEELATMLQCANDNIDLKSSILSQGMDSLKAVQFQYRLENALSISLPVHELFGQDSIADVFILVYEKFTSSRQSNKMTVITESSRQDYPASRGQTSMWSIHKMTPDSSAYHIAKAMKFDAPLDISRFEEAWQMLAQRHSVLRTSYRLVDGTVMQHINAEAGSFFSQSQADGVDDEGVRALLAKKSAVPFNLTNGPVFRIELVIRDGDYFVVMTFHHITIDFHSLVCLLNEFGDIYDGKGFDGLVPLSLSYADFAYWQGEQLAQDAWVASQTYWSQQLAGELPLLTLPADFPRPQSQTYTGDVTSVTLGANMLAELKTTAQQHGVTLNQLLLGCFNLLLYRYSGQNDIIVGTPTLGRPSSELSPLVGYFVNTVALRTFFDSEASFAELIQQVKNTSLAALAHQNYPFDLVATQTSRHASYSPVFQVAFVYQNAGLADNKSMGALLNDSDDAIVLGRSVAAKSLGLPQTTSQFDVTLEVTESADKVDLTWIYNTSLFTSDNANQMLRHFTYIVSGVAKQSDTPLDLYPMIPKGEQQQIMAKLACRTNHDGEGLTIVSKFEAQVVAYPDNVAVMVPDGKQLTYQQLNEQANRLACQLMNQGIKTESRVALCLHRSTDTLVAILAVLKAGAAYIPLDSGHPKERIEHVIKDAGAVLILTHADLCSLTADVKGVDTIVLDDAQSQKLLATNSSSNIEANDSGITPFSLAYVIYTSGSTGKPKGVMVEHHNVIRLFEAVKGHYQFRSEDVWTLFHSYAFDVSVFEMWGPLFHGGKLVVVSGDTAKDSEAFVNLVQQQQVTVMAQTPSAFYPFISLCNFAALHSHLRYVVLAGEKLDCRKIKPWFEAGMTDHTELLNMYGPTETTVYTTFYQINEEDTNTDSSVIGLPLDDMAIYVCNSQMQLQPMGVHGEMMLGGAGLARGYLNHPELTEERFFEHTFDGELTQRLYKSGDMVSLRFDGQVNYHDRMDNQVKIRGFRIELEEIEAVLLDHEDIRDAVVLCHQNDNEQKQLVAYVIVEKVIGKKVSVEQLRNFVARSLPEYMIPTHFMTLDAMPLTVNGKLDKKALPAPQFSREDLACEYEQAHNLTEKAISAVWSSLLLIENDLIGINDNFFALGGDSILAIQMTERLKKQGVKFSTSDVFKYPTISQLAANVGHVTSQITEQDEFDNAFALTPVQRWFFEKDFSQPHHWDQSVMLRIAADVQANVLQQAFEVVVNYHHIFKTRFIDGQQVFSGLFETPKLEHYQMGDKPATEQQAFINDIMTRLHGSFDLAKGPLVGSACFEWSESQSKKLFLSMHHLITDGISWRIFLDDLNTAYQELLNGETVVLSAKTSSFMQWSDKLSSYADSDIVQEELPYWQAVHNKDYGCLPIGQGSEGTDLLEMNSEVLTVSLSSDETTSLLKDSSQMFNTDINDMLLAALVLTLFEFNGRNELLIDVEGHGREAVFEDIDLSHTLGWFTAIYPLALSADPDGNLGNTLKNIKEKRKFVPGKGFNYGVLRYLSQSKQAQTLKSAKGAQVLFNYLGQLDQSFDEGTIYQQMEAVPKGSRSGSDKRTHAFEINTMIRSGQLHVEWGYDTLSYNKETMQGLLLQYLNHLRDLILLCSQCDHFEYTPSDFPLITVEQEKLTAFVADFSKKSPHRIIDIFNVTSTQEEIFFHGMYADTNTLYFEQITCDLKGSFDPKLWQQAWQRIIRHHFILRAGFAGQGLDSPKFVIFKDVILPWQIHDLRDFSLDQATLERDKQLKNQREQGFTLSEVPLMQLHLYFMQDQLTQFVWNFHHGIIDGWSMAIVLRDLLATYKALSDGKEPLMKPTANYREYLSWLNDKTADADRSRQYWREYLSGFNTVTVLNIDKKESIEGDGGNFKHNYSLDFSEAESVKITRFTAQHQLTLSHVIHCVYSIVLAHYSDQLDVIYGETFSGRPGEIDNIDNVPGLFIRTVPSRTRLNMQQDMLTLINAIKTVNQDKSDHVFLPLGEINKLVDTNAGNLFDVLLNINNYPVEESYTTESGVLALEDINHHGESPMALTLIVIPRDVIQMYACYDTERFSQSDINYLLGDIHFVAEFICDHPDKLLADLFDLLHERKRKLRSAKKKPRIIRKRSTTQNPN
ncbi:MAG: amino acid adenylation domain-containing protein [Alteromonadaceae bacterium]|nr:amino acid adenylation domain-containing protein [Alteromonadaceae bacterium]